MLPALEGEGAGKIPIFILVWMNFHIIVSTSASVSLRVEREEEATYTGLEGR